MGYINTSNGYGIFLPRAIRIILRCDVKVMEEKAYRRFKDLPVDDQSEQPIEAPRFVQPYKG